MFLSLSLHAQDETLGGSGACGGSAAGNWTVPCGVTSITVDVYGGGAGAGGAVEEVLVESVIPMAVVLAVGVATPLL